LTCFSFDPVKNITCADGGAITTDSDTLAESLRSARNLGIPTDSWQRRVAGRPWEYEATEPGLRCHMTDLHAAIGNVQLQGFERLRTRKQELLTRYRERLSAIPEVELIAGEIESAFPFLCVIRVPEGSRDDLIDWLNSSGIGAWVHFMPNHLQPAFSDGTGPVSLPVTERVSREILTLPLRNDLTDAELTRVVDSVQAFFEQ
jgi:dTDP-4-amino-4,6-dideoxygalactose transaminase